MEQEVTTILEGRVPDTSENGASIIALARVEVSKFLEVSKTSLLTLCQNIERASTRDALAGAFRQLNSCTRIFTSVDPLGAHNELVREALIALRVSERLKTALTTTSSVSAALKQYKCSVVRDLAISMRQLEATTRVENELDEELLSQLPEPVSPVSDDEARLGLVEMVGRNPAGKRSLPDISSRKPVTKKPRFPVLASVDQITADDGIGGASKQRALMTREKLRAGLHDPKGLLDLVSTSTNALEHTKKLELLKSAGFIFNSTSRSQSAAEKLNAASVRLDVGLRGQSISDSLLFGAKVLSTPGVLSNKNINDIENNFVEGKTTWTHQKTYVKMLTAGCLNQAKRIVEKYDEVLYGPAPEFLVNGTHTAIRKLLTSTECRSFLDDTEVSGPQVADKGDLFIRKIIEAVSPIIPITLRNRSLDGSYLRTALSLLEATEILITQFDEDIRRHANPAGAVGMAQALHSEVERAILYGDQELKPLREFAREMRTQYQTSLGLGKPFPRDTVPGTSRRTRGFRNRSRFRYGRNTGTQVFPGNQLGSTVRGFVPGGRGRDYDWGIPQPGGSGQAQAAPTRGRGACFNYQAGNCLRGRACRFTHNDG